MRVLFSYCSKFDHKALGHITNLIEASWFFLLNPGNSAEFQLRGCQLNSLGFSWIPSIVWTKPQFVTIPSEETPLAQASRRIALVSDWPNRGPSTGIQLNSQEFSWVPLPPPTDSSGHECPLRPRRDQYFHKLYLWNFSAATFFVFWLKNPRKKTSLTESTPVWISQIFFWTKLFSR